MRSFARSSAVLAVLAITLAGCGGGSADDSETSSETTATPTLTVAPADGDQIKGTGYTYNVPKGWATPDQKIPGTETTDSFAADLSDSDGFADNVNVLVQDPTPGAITEDIEDDLVSGLAEGGAKEVKANDRTTIDGDEAVHISSKQDVEGSQNLTSQYYVVHDKVLYVVTTSFSTDVSQADRDKTDASILASWKWTA